MRDWLTDYEQRVVDRREENTNPAGWGDPAQLVFDRHAGDDYEKHLTRGWDA